MPTVYYGDEQGFIGRGNDQDARQDMFASQVASYNDDVLTGSKRTTAVANFERSAPLYRAIAALAKLRAADPALRRGEMVLRGYGEAPGLFAFSRRLDGRETLVAINTSDKPVSAQVLVDTASRGWRGSRGRCARAAQAPGSYRVEVPALDYVVCRATE